MGQRIYRVKFEQYIDGGWQQNVFNRDVAVVGGAEQAIKVAVERDRKEMGGRRVRAEEVTLLAAED